MSNGNRSYVAALGGLIALALAPCGSLAQGVGPQARGDAQISQASERGGAEKEQGGREARPTLAERQAAQEQPTSSEQTAKGREQGEQATDWSNWWADPMATFNAAIVILTVVLATFGVTQYFTSRGLTRRQLRAYVFVDAINMFDGASSKPPIAGKIDVPGATIYIRNTGQTPAYSVIHWGKIDVMDCAHEAALIVPAINVAPNSAIPAGVSINKTVIFPRLITAAEKAAVLAGTHGIYVFGRIEYKDIFNRARETNYRFRYNGNWPPPSTHVLGFCDNGNSAT